MAEWNRKTPWRQGHILTHEASVALKLISAGSDRSVAVVISHDCDLAADPIKEPNLEVIRATLIDESQGQFTHSKNARTLHVQFNRGVERQWIELQAIDKFSISKSELAAFVPRSDFELDRSGHSILESWLAARYRRSAFPDAFVNRLKKSGLDEKLTTILKPHGEKIRSILFDLDQGNEEEKTESADTYSLRIYVLYTTESDPESARLAAEHVRDEIETVFRRKLFEPSRRWSQIELAECIAVSDEVLTIAQSRLLKEWRLEHLSLREDPPQPML
jgi:hypothetical protein